MSTRILVVPAASLAALGPFQGFAPRVEILDALLVPGVAEFRERAEMELDPTYKQIIPYVIFRSGEQVFRYTRGKSGGESRLHRLNSIGVGGHVDEADADGVATLGAYEVALRRELDEEVAIGSPGTLSRIGLINDDDTPVGRVHLGVVHLYDLDRPDVTPREDRLADAGFVAIAEARAGRDAFESWSRHCLDGPLADRRGSWTTNATMGS